VLKSGTFGNVITELIGKTLKIDFKLSKASM